MSDDLFYVNMQTNDNRWQKFQIGLLVKSVSLVVSECLFELLFDLKAFIRVYAFLNGIHLNSSTVSHQIKLNAIVNLSVKICICNLKSFSFKWNSIWIRFAVEMFKMNSMICSSNWWRVDLIRAILLNSEILVRRNLLVNLIHCHYLCGEMLKEGASCAFAFNKLIMCKHIVKIIETNKKSCVCMTIFNSICTKYTLRL